MARILIVEDDAINAEVASIICQAAGHAVDVTVNGAEALRALEAASYDLVLTDVIMPVLDGIELTRRIRESARPYAGIPIVGLTAQAGKADIVEMTDAGMNAVVTKPFRSRVLSDVLARMLPPPSQPMVAPVPPGEVV